MLQQLQQVFHSITKSLEVFYVIEGVKPCARILFPEDELKKVTDFLSEKSVHAFFSDFKVAKQNAQSEFYSDKSIKIPKNAPQKGHFLAYLSKNRDIAQKAKLAEQKNNHKELGLLLGYPECCCNFFADNFDDKNTDLTLKVLENSKGYEFSFYNNIGARHFDVSLLSHFPHSFGCRPSIKTAESNLKILSENSLPLAEIFPKILKSVLVYTTDEGIFLLKNCEKIGEEIAYNEVLTTTKNKLYFLLSSNRKLRIESKKSFFVDDINIKGRRYGICIFN